MPTRSPALAPNQVVKGGSISSLSRVRKKAETTRHSRGTKRGSFRYLLHKKLEEHGINQCTFARANGISNGYVSFLLQGRRGVDLSRVYGWGRYLRLEHNELREFILKSLIDHMEPEAIEILREGPLE
jgi:hypothetical protein